MKKLALPIALLLVITSALGAGCGRVYTAANTGALPRTVPHALDFRFDNCNACHVSDQLAATIPHADFTNDTCTISGCHGALVYTTPSTSPVARPIPHIVTAPLDNCVVCHIPALTGKIIPHAAYKDNTLCLTPACHVVKGSTPATTTPATTTPATTPTTKLTTPTTPAGTTTPPAGTTTPPAGTTTPPAGTTTPPAGTTTPPAGGPPVLTIPGKPLVAATHPAAYAALCMMCHAAGVGVQQYPLPPTWPGTPLTPGPWTITPGSDQDHTNRTDTAECIKAGCHAKSW